MESTINIILMVIAAIILAVSLYAWIKMLNQSNPDNPTEKSDYHHPFEKISENNPKAI